jgi:hypothetical protein
MLVYSNFIFNSCAKLYYYQNHANQLALIYLAVYLICFDLLLALFQIMIGILFFLFEFYDDQMLAFLVLTLVWLCELFTMIRYYFFPNCNLLCIL